MFFPNKKKKKLQHENTSQSSQGEQVEFLPPVFPDEEHPLV